MKIQVRKNKKLTPSMLDTDEVYHDDEIQIKSNLYRNNFEFIDIFPFIQPNQITSTFPKYTDYIL